MSERERERERGFEAVRLFKKAFKIPYTALFYLAAVGAAKEWGGGGREEYGTRSHTRHDME